MNRIGIKYGYININQDGNYTKHYYADAARIASKIGNGFTDTANLYYSNSSAFLDSAMITELTELTGDTIESIDNKYDSLWLQIDSGKYENALYFYHGNHLSSTQLITDVHGAVSQAVLYAPFGQVISEYRQDWKLDTIPRFLFTGMERDDESGMDYMNARYYSSDYNIFISRDLLFEKYFWMSPYTYCFNNPMKYIDPTGMGGEATIEGDDIVVKVHLVFYGDAANQKLANKARADAESVWNAANGSTTIDGKEYCVRFEVTAEVVTVGKAMEMASKNRSAAMNFIRVENRGKDNEEIRGSFVNSLGSNAMYLFASDILESSTVIAHELGYTFGLNESSNYQQGWGTPPDIMTQKNSYVDPPYQLPNSGGRIDQEKRTVQQHNITEMFNGVKWVNGKANIGRHPNTILQLNGGNRINPFIP